MRLLVENIGALSTPVLTGSKAYEWTSSHGDFALAANEGIIEYVGTRDGISGSFDHVVDAGKRLVTPGLIDAHTHPAFGGNRCGEFEMRSQGATYEEVAEAGGGIRSSMRSTRILGESELLGQLRKHAGWFLANGTTTVEAKTGYGLDFGSEMASLNAIAALSAEGPLRIHPTLLALHSVPPDFEGRKAEYVELVVQELLPTAAHSGLVEWTDIFVEKGYFEAADAELLAASARECGVGLRAHVDQLHDSGGAALAAELGFDTADHLENSSFDGIRVLAKSGAIPILLPASVYALGKSRYPDARFMLELGMPVVLATDFNPGSSPTPSLPFVMNLACVEMKMSPKECWLAVTAHAALSLKAQHSVGRLERGLSADFVIWDADDDREIPYWIGAPLVNRVFIGGKCAIGDHSKARSG